MLGCFKELGYSATEKIYFRDPTFGMNVLVDDKGVLEIVDLYRVHLNIDVYIQHTFSQPEYYDGPLDEIEVDHDDIVDEIEQVLVAMYDEVVNMELKETEATETELKVTEEMTTEANHDNVHGGVGVHDDISSYDTMDESFNYDSAMEVAFEEESDEYDDELVEKDEMTNLICK